MKTQIQLSLFGILFPFIVSAQWISQATGFENPNIGLWDISIADENTVWALAYDGADPLGMFASLSEFTKTTDGGMTWTTGSFPAQYAYSNISAVSADIAWISAVSATTGTDGAILKTIDGGLTWTEQGVGSIFNSSSYANFVHFWNENDGVAMGDPNPTEFEIYTTSDGGENWILTPVDAIPNPLSNEYGIFRNFVTIDEHIWFSTSRARIYHSADMGLTWTVSNTGITPTGFDGIDFAFWNQNEGIARKYNSINNTNPQVVKTIDGGANWNPVSVSGPFYGSLYGGIAYVPGTASTLVSTGVGNEYGTAGGSGNAAGSSYSTDGGETWTTIDSGVQHYFTKFLNPSTGWSAGFNTKSTNGGIYKFDGTILSTVIAENGKPISFKVYPNPSEGQLTVEMTTTENENIKFIILDVTGSLILEKKFGSSGGSFVHTLDLTKFAKGSYILRIENGTVHHSERIVVM